LTLSCLYGGDVQGGVISTEENKKVSRASSTLSYSAGGLPKAPEERSGAPVGPEQPIIKRAPRPTLGLYPRTNRRVEYRSPSPQTCRGPHSSVRVPYVRTSVRGPKTIGRSPTKAFRPGLYLCHPDRSGGTCGAPRVLIHSALLGHLLAETGFACTPLRRQPRVCSRNCLTARSSARPIARSKASAASDVLCNRCNRWPRTAQ
jgi:hypothetical protein